MISGSVDLGLAVGTLGAISAFSKGAPMRIIGAEATGAADYWFVKTSSPIKTLKDLNGHTIAFSTEGSSTESVVRAFIKENRPDQRQGDVDRQWRRDHGRGDERTRSTSAGLRRRSG